MLRKPPWGTQRKPRLPLSSKPVFTTVSTTFHSAQEEMERLQAKAKTTTEAKPEAVAESTEETKAA